MTAPPIPEPLEVDGAELLAELHATILRYLVLPSPDAAVAMVLWIAATHAQDCWEHATRLVAKSPLKRCGKSRLLDLVEHLAYNVLVTGNISPAALGRAITPTDPPTLVCDEMDAIFAKRRGERSEAAEILRGLINSGHQRGRPYTRWDAGRRQLEQCPTFAMAALAGIGDLPDTIEDRAVVITMRRRAPGEQVTPLRRRRDVPALLDLRERLHTWMDASRENLEAASPAMPVEDRAADCWEPLMAIADLAGGDWPERARKACRVMTAEASADAEGTRGERLLADLRTVFGDAQALWTSTIIEGLAKLDEAPWGDYYGQRITDRAVAKLLRPYGVRSRDVKLEATVRKGYRREDLYDAWRRYAPHALQALPPLPQATITGLTSENDGSAQVALGSAPAASATKRDPLTSEVAQVAEVALPGANGPRAYRCAGCGRQSTALVDMTGLPHPGCPAGGNPRFQPAEAAR